MGFYRWIFIEIIFIELLPLYNIVQPFFLLLATDLVFVALIVVWVGPVLVKVESINLNEIKIYQYFWKFSFSIKIKPTFQLLCITQAVFPWVA